MVGLGVMGRNLVLNMDDNGFSVAGYDRDPNQVEALRREKAERGISAAAAVADFVALFRRPRVVMMVMPVGAPVDSVIRARKGLCEQVLFTRVLCIPSPATEPPFSQSWTARFLPG